MRFLPATPIFILIFMTMICCAAKDGAQNQDNFKELSQIRNLDTAIFASGCFWCTEAVFERIKGVEMVVSGYSGGTKPNPTYRQVSSGKTDYAEAVRVLYNADVISYKGLVEIFFASHDPTQLNRQGPDVGRQYRSAIFYRNEEQKNSAQEVKGRLENSGKYEDPIVTEITEFTTFYKAEDYHQGYYEEHPNDPYIVAVSKPKVEKFMKEFHDKLKEEYQ